MGAAAGAAAADHRRDVERDEGQEVEGGIQAHLVVADPAQTGGRQGSRSRSDDDGEEVLEPAPAAVGGRGPLVVSELGQGQAAPAQGDRWPEGEDERAEDELPAAKELGEVRALGGEVGCHGESLRARLLAASAARARSGSPLGWIGSWVTQVLKASRSAVT